MKPTLILGIGNLLLRDEGVGVHVVRALEHRDLPDGVELIDGGTTGADLIDAIADRELVVVVDTMESGAPPGTIRRLTPDELDPDGDSALSLHEFGLLDTLAAAACLGCAPQRVVVVGVEPADVSTGIELSPEVEAVFAELIEIVLGELQGKCGVT